MLDENCHEICHNIGSVARDNARNRESGFPICALEMHPLRVTGEGGISREIVVQLFRAVSRSPRILSSIAREYTRNDWSLVV